MQARVVRSARPRTPWACQYRAHFFYFATYAAAQKQADAFNGK